jgi:hypothetical protein
MDNAAGVECHGVDRLGTLDTRYSLWVGESADSGEKHMLPVHGPAAGQCLLATKLE